MTVRFNKTMNVVLTGLSLYGFKYVFNSSRANYS